MTTATMSIGDVIIPEVRSCTYTDEELKITSNYVGNPAIHASGPVKITWRHDRIEHTFTGTVGELTRFGLESSTRAVTTADYTFSLTKPIQSSGVSVAK